MLRCLVAGILFFLALDAALPTRAVAADRGPQAPSEYEVKAAFLYNFIKFVEWPADVDDGQKNLRLCVLGDVPEKSPFIALDGQEVMGRRISVAMLKDLQDVRGCRVLFVAQNMSRRLKEIGTAARDGHILTVGDTDGYGRQGIMINMYIEKKRIRFEINAKTARAAGLRISARLMSLARSISEEGEEDE